MLQLDELRRLREQHGTWGNVALQLGANANTLRGWYSKLRARALPLEAPEVPKRGIITDVPWHQRSVETVPELKDDSDEIHAAIAALSLLHRPACIAIHSDHHFGDEDVRALALHIEITRETQPDMIIDNGDVFDFDTLSTFAKSRSVPLADALHTVAPQYMRYVEARREASTAVVIHQTGNHDRRMNKRLDEAWMFADTVVERYAALVRHGGRVLWGGWLEELDIYALNVRHGERTNKHAAESTVANDLAFGMSMVMGHTHRFGMTVKPQRTGTRRRYVMALNLGYAGRVPPAYKHHLKAVDWVHGSVLAHVYPNEFRIVNLQPIVYHETGSGGMVAFVGTQRIEVDKDGGRVSP